LTEKGDNGANKALPAIYVYGRVRQLVAERTGKLPEDAFEVIRRDNGESQTVHYNTRVPYEKWMNGSMLQLMATVQGCADCQKEEDLANIHPVLLEQYVVKPVIAFVKPAAEIKVRAEKGSAYLDFPVNKTTIYPEYRRNPYELEEINRTINVVKENPDTKITGISLHGYASPEGSYSNNTRLAIGRSEALKKYIMDKYGLSADMFTVESTPEDWANLRAYVEKSNIAIKDQILELIDSDMDNLDVKENRLKALDMKTYQALLRDCYPGLRHTDYVIHYTVRPYNLEEAKALLKTRPQLLSLEEMYLVAQTYEEGSEEYNEVFDIAVRMYPQDPIANINAAAMELKRGNVDQAQRYLERSDVASAAAQNNKGVYHMLKGNLTEAEACFNKAKELGAADVDVNLEELRKKRDDNRAFGIME
jgi:outer membrane protein OmpA-like peptidoglycan-associated protein